MAWMGRCAVVQVFKRAGWLLAVGLTLSFIGCGGHSSSTPSPASAAAEVLYAAPAGSLLNTFITAKLNPSNGSFASTSVMTTPFATGIVVVGGKYLYLSTGMGLYGWSINASDGSLTALSGSPFTLRKGASPLALAAVPNSNLIFATDGAFIDGLAIDLATGAPAAVPGSPFTTGEQASAVAVDPSGRYLYVSLNSSPATVAGFSIAPNGALTPLTGSPFAMPGQATSASLPAAMVDTGSFVYIALSGADQIAAFSVISSTGALAPVPGSPFASLKAPGAMAVAAGFLYTSSELANGLAGYTIDANTGALSPIPGSPFRSGATAIVADSRGEHLYASVFDGIADFDIDASTGVLSPGNAFTSHDGSVLMAIVRLPAAP